MFTECECGRKLRRGSNMCKSCALHWYRVQWEKLQREQVKKESCFRLLYCPVYCNHEDECPVKIGGVCATSNPCKMPDLWNEKTPIVISDAYGLEMNEP